MKKHFFVPLVVLELSSYEEEYGLDNDFIVLTNYSKANFTEHDFFFHFGPDNEEQRTLDKQRLKAAL